jgi:hypothetical protein
MRGTSYPSPLTIVALLATSLALAGCTTSPPASITLHAPASFASPSQVVSLGDVNVQTLHWQTIKPSCKGDCPRIEVDSVAFPDIPRLSELIDHVLAYMTGVGNNRPAPYTTLAQYAEYFWQTAQARDATYFQAKVKEVVGDIIVIELRTEQYLTGAAHAIPATQYLNWQRSHARVLALDEALLPGRQEEFVAALRQAHERWLGQNAEAMRDPVAYNRMWPFQENRNFALTHAGVVVKYDAYTIAPYSQGQPELVIPYDKLRDLLKPQFLPAAAR